MNQTVPYSITTGPCLAQTDVASVLSLGLWLMLAAVLAIGGAYLALAIRGRVQREQQEEPFTLQDLREMRARNELTEREYASLRAALLGRAAAAAPKSPDESPSQSGPSPEEE